MAKQAQLSGVACAETVELPGKKPDGSLGTLRFTCDNQEPDHQAHHHLGILGERTKPGGAHIRFSIIWQKIRNRLPVLPPSARN